MKDVIALMLAGGKANAMSVLTAKRSMAAVPCLGLYRIIDFPLTNLLESGVSKVGILSQYRPLSLMDHVGIGKPWDYNGRTRQLSFLPPFEAQEAHDWYKGTADAIFQNLHFIQRYKPRDCLVLSGDHVYRMNYGPVLDFHRRNKADLTMVFKEMDVGNPSRFGIGVLGKRNRVISYFEKPNDPPTNLASLTIYIFRTEVLVEAVKRNAEKGKTFHLYDEVIPELVNDGKVFGYVFEGGWEYMRPLAGYYEAHMKMVNGKLGIDYSRVLTNLEEQKVTEDPPAYFGTSGKIHRSFIGPGARIEGHVRNSVIFPRVVVEKDAIVENSVLLHDVYIGRGAVIRRCVADKKVVIGEGCVVDGETDLVAIAKNVVIPPQSYVGKGEVFEGEKR